MRRACEPLIDNYVKTGQVSYEFRNYVRDPFDLTASLIARCNGAKSFFPLARALLQGPAELGRQDAGGSAGPDSGAAEPAAEPAIRRRSPSSPASRTGRRRAAFRRRRPTQCLANRECGQPAGPDEQRRDDAIPGFPGHADVHHQWQDGRARPADLGDQLEAELDKAARRRKRARAGDEQLRIRRLKLSGFKSFVEPAELRIEPGLTGVVGPNGCGKSNLLEAIRWAMGESQPQVAARRRHGRRDLRRHRDAPAARFRRGLDPARARLRPTTAARGESEVTRRIERGAGSAYRIDGRDVRAKDVSLAVRRRRDRRPFAGAGQPGQDRRGHRRQAGRAPPDARRSGRASPAFMHGARTPSRSCARPKPISPGSAKSSATRSSAPAQLRRQARAAERYRKLTRQNPRRRGAAAPRPLGRGGARGGGRERRSAGGGRSRSRRSRRRSPRRRRRRSAANAALAERRNALDRAARAGARTRPPAGGGAGAARHGRRAGSPSSTGSMLRSPADIAREEALQGDAGAGDRPARRRARRRSSSGSRIPRAHAARIAAELSSAEAASREAEAALAELLARQAAMRAERRVAEAALEAAQAQLARTEQERQQARRAARGARRRQRTGARAQTKPRRRPRRRRKALAEAEARRVEAEQGRAAAAERRDAAESQLASARAALSAAKSEHDALARALEHGGGAAIASLKAEPGYERALAAALGEDADAAIGKATARAAGRGARRSPGDPALPAGCDCLADHVDGSAGAVAAAEAGRASPMRTTGQPLAVGQRLVTRDGRLRRWDGFVAIGAGAAAAERLLRANRLAELAARAAGAGSRRSTNAAGERDARACRDGAMPRRRPRRRATPRSRPSARRARRRAASDAAAAAIERIEAQRAGLASARPTWRRCSKPRGKR